MKIKLPASCIAIVLWLGSSLQPLLAQWETNGPYGGYITSLTSQNNEVYAGTFANGVFRSSDEGKTWTAVNKGMQGLWVRDMVSNSTGIFAGTIYNGVFFSADNGATWTTRNSGLLSLEIESMFASGSDIFATTLYGIYYSADNGMNWAKRYNGMSATTRFNTWGRMGDTIFGGSNGQGLFMTGDKGQNWVKVTAGFPTQGAFYIFSLATSGNTVYAATSAGIYVSADGGVSWVKPANTFSSPPYATRIAVHNGSLIVGAANDGIYVSNDGAATFTKASSGLPYFSAGGVYSPAEDFVSVNNSLIAALQSGVYRTDDHAASWQDGSMGILNTRMQDVVYNGQLAAASTDYAGVFISQDKGKTWNRSNNGLPSHRMRFMAASGSDLFVSELFGTVYRSSDNGVSWNYAGTGLSGSVQLLEADNARVMAAIEAPFLLSRVFQTLDKGTSWTELTVPEIPYGVSAIGIHGKRIYLGGTGVLQRSPDEGLTWTDVGQYLPSSKVTTILALDSVTYVGTENKGIFMFLKNDSYMKAVNNGLTNYNISDIVLQNGVLFASTLGGGVFASVDGGNMWFAVNGGLDNLFVRKMASTDLKLFAATRLGVYQTIDVAFDNIQVLASVNENEALDDVTFYPNPSKGIISYSSDAAGMVIHVYNVNGQLVYSQQQQGVSNGNIDLTSQPRGVYLMKLSSEKGATVKRIVLE